MLIHALWLLLGLCLISFVTVAYASLVVASRSDDVMEEMWCLECQQKQHPELFC
jgi:hypothetical protein